MVKVTVFVVFVVVAAFVVVVAVVVVAAFVVVVADAGVVVEVVVAEAVVDVAVVVDVFADAVGSVFCAGETGVDAAADVGADSRNVAVATAGSALMLPHLVPSTQQQQPKKQNMKPNSTQVDMYISHIIY